VPALVAVRVAARGTSLALLALLIITPLVQIMMRGVFGVPLSGAEELAKFFLICLVLVGASCVSAEGGQIRMEEFLAILPPVIQRPLRLVIDGFAVAVFALLFVASLVTVSRNLNSVTPVLEIPFAIFFAPLVLGSALLTLESVVALANTWTGARVTSKQTILS
jgi:TRAP-type C4-dicarboxylate transport system permease small subunit